MLADYKPMPSQSYCELDLGNFADTLRLSNFLNFTYEEKTRFLLLIISKFQNNRI